MPVVSLFPTYSRIDTYVYENTTFSYEIYTNPSDQPQTIQDRCVEILANPKGRLGITEQSVREGMRDKDYTAILLVRNTMAEDQVSGSMQYFDWLEYGSSQALVTDLCRITENCTKSSVSPLRVLFRLYEALLSSANVHSMYLMVDPSSQRLLTHYADEYGFQELDICTEDDESIMQKSFTNYQV
jgi:hypothetical protein